MIIILICLLLLILIAYMLKLAFENNVKNHKVVFEGEEEKLRLFFISDVHLRKINEKMIEQIKKPIHAVIIGGDLADGRTPIGKIQTNLQILKRLGPIFFVWGNNDREVGEEKLRDLFQKENITIIENDIVQVSDKNRCKLVAIDDLTTGTPKIEKAFEHCQTEDNIFFICHNPQIFPQIIEQYKPKLLLGGHYHGGQIRLGPFGIFPKGYFKKVEDSIVLISNGYGTTTIPLRFGAKQECHIIDITFQDK